MSMFRNHVVKLELPSFRKLPELSLVEPFKARIQNWRRERFRAFCDVESAAGRHRTWIPWMWSCVAGGSAMYRGLSTGLVVARGTRDEGLRFRACYNVAGHRLTWTPVDMWSFVVGGSAMHRELSRGLMVTRGTEDEESRCNESVERIASSVCRGDFSQNKSLSSSYAPYVRQHFSVGRHGLVPSRNTILMWVNNFRTISSASKRRPKALVFLNRCMRLVSVILRCDVSEKQSRTPGLLGSLSIYVLAYKSLVIYRRCTSYRVI
ncbi:hypothetical protein ANN_01035 [Periplaneta americana]|uniref:Uncharacterized protein n=1 Tax=Periplaneta americana TaxID=6978 RepID=A0ABQ8TU53_PERAM|nr:hypothetical protein ANN_01035 [Periplaneta americana]